MTNHNQWLFRQQLSVVSLTKILLDPFVAVLVLIGCTLYFDEPFRGPYPILALIVFTLTLIKRKNPAFGKRRGLSAV